MLVVWAVIGSAPQARAEQELVNGVQAVVHDCVVTVAEVEIMTLPARDMITREHRSQPEVFLKKLSDARNDSLEELIKRQLILRDFKVTVSQSERNDFIDKQIKKEVDQELDAEIRTHYGGNRMSLIQTMQSEGVTLERHRQQIRDRIIITWLRQKNISSELIVSPHRVEVYYLAHREEFKVQEEVKLRMIALTCPEESEAARVEKLAEDILRKLKEGATFAEMATIHSEGSQRNQGGDLGWNELSKLPKYYADPAASLQQGQQSAVMSRSAGIEDYWVCQYADGVAIVGRHYEARPVYAADGVSKKETLVEERRLDSASAVTNLPPPVEFYLLLVEEKRPERFKTLTEVREQIEKDLLAQERTRLEKQWVDKLKKKTFVRVF